MFENTTNMYYSDDSSEIENDAIEKGTFSTTFSFVFPISNYLQGLNK